MKLFTATASLLTAFLLWRVIPVALALPSRSQLEAANLALARQIAVREEAEATAQRLNLELERRVEERTSELEAANEHLHAALRQKEVLLREVHHRVKNNRQVVVGLLTLQVRHADPGLLVHFQESLERLRSMGLQFVRMLSRQIGAGVTFEPGFGTRFKLVLPRLSTHDRITA